MRIYKKQGRISKIKGDGFDIKINKKITILHGYNCFENELLLELIYNDLNREAIYINGHDHNNKLLLANIISKNNKRIYSMNKEKKDLLCSCKLHKKKLIIDDKMGFGIEYNKNTIQSLSFGECNYLYILLSAYLSNVNDIMLLNFPEIGLHMDLQESILDNIFNLNNTLQLIVITFSPNIIINGYLNDVVSI